MIVLCIDSGTVVRAFPVQGRSIRAVREEEKENEEPDSQASGCSQAYLIRSQKLLNCIHRKVMMQRGRGSKIFCGRFQVETPHSPRKSWVISNFWRRCCSKELMEAGIKPNKIKVIEPKTEVLAVCLVTSCSSAEMDVAAKGWAAALKEGPFWP